jgi:hypothetical protein
VEGLTKWPVDVTAFSKASERSSVSNEVQNGESPKPFSTERFNEIRRLR